jgi:raffinose/stachyose/melibiose transport system permease protein
MRILNNKKALAVFIVPALLLYTLILFVPMAQSLYYSLLDWNGIGKPTFIGLQNFIKLFHDRVFLIAARNNLLYILQVVSMQLICGFFVAVLLLYLKRGRGFIQTVYYIPSVITVIAIAQLFRSFYSIEPVGLFNKIRMLFGAGPIAFLSNFDTVLPAVAAVEGWQYIGIYMLIFYAALSSIPRDIEEAARIDGATELQLLLRIRIPQIKNVIGLSFILSFVGALRGFAAPMSLTRGGPNNQSEILATYMFKKAFTSQMLGYGSAIALIIAALSCVCVILISRYADEEERS